MESRETKFTYIDIRVFDDQICHKLIKALLASQWHLIDANNPNTKITTRPTHGKPPKKHPLANDPPKPKLSKLRNHNVATPPIYMHKPPHKRPTHSPTQPTIRQIAHTLQTNKNTICYTFTNVGNQHSCPQATTVPLCLLQCTTPLTYAIALFN